MIKYRHPIPKHDDMLNELHMSYMFFKIDLKSGYYQIRMKRQMNGILPLKLNMIYMRA
jgi:hypothetical protein